MGNANRLQTERLIAVIERALNVIKHWVSEEDGNYDKRYLLLSMALSSVKARYSKDNALDAVSETLRTSINTCKSILLRNNEAGPTIGRGLARNETAEFENSSLVDDTNVTSGAQETAECFLDPMLAGDVHYGGSGWDGLFVQDIDRVS
ncbi:hypothetical protein VTN96DRAFT_9428 [Rasamsonia emersonii]